RRSARPTRWPSTRRAGRRPRGACSLRCTTSWGSTTSTRSTTRPSGRCRSSARASRSRSWSGERAAGAGDGPRVPGGGDRLPRPLPARPRGGPALRDALRQLQLVRRTLPGVRGVVPVARVRGGDGPVRVPHLADRGPAAGGVAVRLGRGEGAVPGVDRLPPRTHGPDRRATRLPPPRAGRVLTPAAR